jgi:hypothetical protein
MHNEVPSSLRALLYSSLPHKRIYLCSTSEEALTPCRWDGRGKWKRKKDFPERKIHLYDVDGNIQQSSGGRVKKAKQGLWKVAHWCMDNPHRQERNMQALRIRRVFFTVA